jgi:hypothetical protein
MTTTNGQSKTVGSHGYETTDTASFSVPAGEKTVGFRVVTTEYIFRLNIVTVAPTSCATFDMPKYHAPKPVITASATGSSVSVAVTMYRQDLLNIATPIFHNLNTAEVASNVCRQPGAGDNAVASAGQAWTHTSNDCSDTYTLTQSLAQIVGSTSNNNWVATLAGDGRSILYTVPIYATYSVNAPAGCYYVGYRSTISFRTQLSVSSTSDTFITADNSAKFVFSGIRITPTNRLEISGKVTPLIPNSQLRNIAMKKVAGQVAITASAATCTTYNVACDEVYSVDVASLGAAGTDIGGQYDNTMEVFENNVKTRDVTLSYQLSYIIPGDPAVVDSDTITMDNKLYTDNTYTTVRTASYATSVDKLYVQNAVSATSPAIPASYKLRYDKGYVCCVNYLSAISVYNPTTDSGGCRDSAGKLEWVDLSVASGVQMTPSDTLGNKKYRVEVTLNSAYLSANHPSPMTCQVLLISKFENPARRIEGANLDSTYVSTSSFLIEATKVISSANTVGVSVVAVLVVLVSMLL